MGRKPKIRCVEGLFLFDDEYGVERHMGYLLVIRKRVFDASFGLVEIKPQHADRHNRLLSAAEIIGLDSCEVGKGRDFYFSEDNRRVHTWTGEVVTGDLRVAGTVITLERNGKSYRGWRRKTSDDFFLKRIK